MQRGTIDKDLKIREKIPLPMKSIDLLKIFVEICDGIKIFHNFRPTPLAHRDIKTSNILLSSDGSPVIMDLGKYYILVFIYEY